MCPKLLPDTCTKLKLCIYQDINSEVVNLPCPVCNNHTFKVLFDRHKNAMFKCALCDTLSELSPSLLVKLK